MGRKISITFLLLAIGCLALFPRQIVMKCLGWTLRGITYESLTWEKGQIVMCGARMTKSGAYEMTFEKATLLPQFGWASLGGDLSLEGVQLYLQKVPNLGKPPRFLAFDLSLSEGKLHSGTTFSLQCHLSRKKSVGMCVVSFAESATPVTVHFTRSEGSPMHIVSRFEDQPLQDLARLARAANKGEHPYLDWSFSKGTIGGEFSLQLEEDTIATARGELTLTEVVGENLSLGLVGSVEEWSTDLSLSSPSFRHWDGEIAMKGARVAFHENHPEIWQGMWDLQVAQSHIVVKDGKVENSAFAANLMGLEGELTLDWLSSDVLMKMAFSGVSSEILPLIPEQFKDSFAQAFPEDQFAISALVTRSQSGLNLEGAMTIEDDKTYALEFGCHFGQSPPSDVLGTWKTHLKDQFCLSTRRLGWFRGEGFPVEKFLSPFLLRGVNIDARGRTNFEGTFDERFLVVFYEGDDFCLESPGFSVAAKRVDTGKTSDVVAVHYLDLSTWDHQGFMPLKEAIYQQKKYGVTFRDASGLIHFSKGKIEIKDIATRWQALHFAGDMEIDIRTLEDVDLTLCTKRITGQASEAQAFIAHYVPSPFWQFPLEGSVESGENEVKFRFQFQPKSRLVEAKVAGSCDVSTRCLLGSIEGYKARFAYDFAKNQVALEQGSGRISTAQGEYRLATPSIVLSELPHLQINGALELFSGETSLWKVSGGSIGDQYQREFAVNGEGLQLRGMQEGNQLVLDKFQVGSVTGALACFWKKPTCDITFLSLDWGAGSASLQGEVADGVFRGALKAFRLDLGALAHLSRHSPTVEKLLALWEPKGVIEGSGTLVGSGKDIDATLLATFDGLEVGGFHFGAGENLHCSFTSNLGLTVEGLQVTLPGQERCKLGRFHYDLVRKRMLFDCFDFSLPPERVYWLSQRAQELFPGQIHPSVIHYVRQLKQRDHLEGKLSLEFFPESVWVYLALNDGVYRVMEKDLYLKAPYLTYDPCELSLSATTPFRGQDVWVGVKGETMDFSRGKVILRESQESPESLISTWERPSGGDWVMREMEGSFSGLRAQLKEKSPQHGPGEIRMVGRINIDANRLAPFLSPGWQRGIDKLRIGDGYSVEGEFVCPIFYPQNLAFAGYLLGDECSLGGMTFESFYAQASYEKGKLSLHHVSMDDRGGKLYAQHAIAEAHDGKWHIYLPELSMSNIRFSRLRKQWSRGPKHGKQLFSTLAIPSFELKNLVGVVGEKTSFSGGGDLHFTNFPKQTFLSPILYLPTEITGRIGLDLGVLVPARGTIQYEIRDGRVYLTQFKNMYSDGKRSRFYLAYGQPAFVDFDGNLNFKVKMKQYNLLMKLAEFFTVTVKGTLLNPSYTLKNQFEQPDPFEDE